MPKRCWVASGTDIQNLYQAYWISRGASEEDKLTPALMFNFTGNSCYDKCLFNRQSSFALAVWRPICLCILL
jgi:hypothetical protein